MTEPGDIRRALEELSSHPPVRDRKREVQERIAVKRRRNNVISGVTLSVLLLLVGIAFTARPTGRGGTPDDAAAVSISPSPMLAPQPTPEPTPAGDSSEPVESDDVVVARPSERNSNISAAVGTTAKAPTTVTATTTVTAPPKTSAAAHPNSPSFRPPLSSSAVPTSKPSVPSSPSTPPKSSAPATTSATTSVSPSTDPSPSGSGAATDEALTAAITTQMVQDGSAAPETIITVRLTGTVHAGVRDIAVWYTTIKNPNYWDRQDLPCLPATSGVKSVDETYTFRTRYRAAGQQKISADVTTYGPDCAAVGQAYSFTGDAEIPVGSPLSNGLRPVKLFAYVADSNGRIAIQASAADQDGSIATFTVDWGNGTTETFNGGGTVDCASTESGGVFWPSVAGSGRFEGPQVTPGDYTVTITATSTGCDGTDPQTTQTTLPATVS